MLILAIITPGCGRDNAGQANIVGKPAPPTPGLTPGEVKKKNSGLSPTALPPNYPKPAGR